MLVSLYCQQIKKMEGPIKITKMSLLAEKKSSDSRSIQKINLNPDVADLFFLNESS